MLGPLIIGNIVFKLDAVNSTNTYAQELLKNQKIDEGLVVWAVDQMQGRGQMGTNWHSTSGDSLTFSVILTPRFLPVHSQFLLNMAISCAVQDYAFSRGITDAMIKWPNDLYIGSKKAGGILIENVIAGNKLQSSVIGIGINLRQQQFADLPHATSFYIQTGRTYEAEDEFHALLRFLDIWYLRLRRKDYEGIRNEYRERLYGRDEWLRYRAADEIFTARVNGVTANGLLELLKEDGSLVEFRLKEVEKLNE